MAKKFGDVVTLIRNGQPLNALVAQSQPQADGEHLTVLYLDPAFDSPIISGAALQRAVATFFAVPLKDGAVNGWKDVEVLSEQQILQMQANAADALAKDDAEWEKKVEALEAQLAQAGDAISKLHDAHQDAYLSGHNAGFQ